MKQPAPSRRSVITGVTVALSLFVAGCGDDDGEQAQVGDPTATPEGEGAAEAGTVTVTDATGVEQTITVTGSGVYALDEWTATSLLALGVTPMMVETFGQDTTIAEILEDEGVPTTAAGSIEAISEADPDLIIGIGFPTLVELAEQHGGIAPTVYTGFSDPWDEQLALIAQVTGRTDRAEAIDQAIQERIDELAAAIDDAGYGGSTFSTLQNFDGTFYAYSPLTLVGTLLEELGFTRSDLQSGVDSDLGFFPISEELLAAESDADIVVSFTGESGGFTSAFDSPLVIPETTRSPPTSATPGPRPTPSPRGSSSTTSKRSCSATVSPRRLPTPSSCGPSSRPPSPTAVTDARRAALRRSERWWCSMPGRRAAGRGRGRGRRRGPARRRRRGGGRRCG